MIIPYTKLSKDALRAVIEEFITREGTFVGDGDMPDLERDVLKVIEQLDSGKIVLTFDEDMGTTHLVRAQ